MNGLTLTSWRPSWRSERGFTLVELALAILVISVLLATITMSAGFLDNARAQTIIQDIQTLQQAAARWLERGRLDYSTVSVAAMKSEGELASTWGATNPYGGAYTVEPSATDSTHLTVTAAALTTTVGNNLVSYYTGRAQSVGFASGTLSVTF